MSRKVIITKKQDNPLEDQIGGSHYKDFEIQPIEFIEKNGLSFTEGNIVKYICRHSQKGGAQDIDKVIHYAKMLKEMHYGKHKPVAL